ERKVLDRRQAHVPIELPARHPAFEESSSQHSGAEDRIALIPEQWLHQLGNHHGIVLVIRMHHHDNVGALAERLRVTGLLVASIPPIARMSNAGNSQSGG